MVGAQIMMNPAALAVILLILLNRIGLTLSFLTLYPLVSM